MWVYKVIIYVICGWHMSWMYHFRSNSFKGWTVCSWNETWRKETIFEPMTLGYDHKQNLDGLWTLTVLRAVAFPLLCHMTNKCHLKFSHALEARQMFWWLKNQRSFLVTSVSALLIKNNNNCSNPVLYLCLKYVTKAYTQEVHYLQIYFPLFTPI